ncbi:MAG: SDR family NAD(P)-dependent oxidoreductase [Hoeflea sp.]|uniref:SDR family NAD(P)-dependent oxidoreductase n=1 Tax=Hoeflea sp. TaxID=1940281 RepID=UPI0032EC1875
MDISSQIALVTGGGSGLGAATARHLAGKGVKVAVVDLDKARAEGVADEFGGLAVATDVTDRNSVEAAFGIVARELGDAPRIVVNCAGIGNAARIVDRDGNLSLDLFERIIQVNLLGTFTVLSFAARAMAKLDVLNKDGERGVIINTASVAWEDGQIGQTAYAASKGGIASMTLPAARELARDGIRIATIAPGLFETGMTAGLRDDIRAALSASIPFPQRLGLPQEYAQVAETIVTNPMINGTVIRLDGAIRLPPK